MVFIWIIAGIISISAAFLIPAQSSDIWTSYVYTGCVLLVYLILLLIYILRDPIALKQRIFIGFIALVSIAAVGFHWSGMMTTTRWQKNRLLNIKGSIVRGILNSECPKILLPVLEQHYSKGNLKGISLSKQFMEILPQSYRGKNLFTSSCMEDSIRIFLTSISDSEIVLTGSHAFAQGKNSEFIPFWGRKGTLQERYILTAKGVRHESDN